MIGAQDSCVAAFATTSSIFSRVTGTVIRREGRHVVLSPMFKDWDDYFKNSTPLPDDFEAIMAEMRKEELPLEEREPFD